MSSKQSTADFLVDQFSQAGEITAKRMFGEFGIYLRGKLFALVCDDQLFVKMTDEGKRFLGNHQEGSPYPGAKPAFLIPGERWDDADFLAELARITADALPEPKKPRKTPTRQPARR